MMNQDTVPGPSRRIFARRRLELEARLDEVRPAEAEAGRIRRELRSLDAAEAQYEAAAAGAETEGTGRKRFPNEVRRLQALALIGARPEILRADLARNLGVQRSRAGKIVNSLVRDGLVEEHGRRSLVITDAGRNVLEGRHSETPRLEVDFSPVDTRTEAEE
jgi:DNA-binding MarR family transcriptional regulator